MDDQQRELVGPDATLVWTVEADSNFEAMTLYYEYRGWGVYTTPFLEEDKQPYEQSG